jgi:hypothetical protein
VLERLGWKFERIRSSEFLVEPERAMAPVLARLASLGIVPGRRSEAEGEPGRALVEEITRLAREIRAGLAPERIRLAAAPQESREPAAQE